VLVPGLSGGDASESPRTVGSWTVDSNEDDPNATLGLT
jgi:hypothetical protein